MKIETCEFLQMVLTKFMIMLRNTLLFVTVRKEEMINTSILCRYEASILWREILEMQVVSLF